MSDEARHVAFGVLSLKEYYDELTDAEMLERQEFAFEAAVRMRDRFLQQEVWERMGVDAARWSCDAARRRRPSEQIRSSSCCSRRSCPNCKKLGLLDANDGWLRKRFEEIGVIQFEDWADTGEEYLEFDAVSQDRRAAPTDRQGLIARVAQRVRRGDNLLRRDRERPRRPRPAQPARRAQLDDPRVLDGAARASCRASAPRDRPRAIVMSSTGKHFSAGMDLAVFTGGGGDGGGVAGEAGRAAEAGRRAGPAPRDGAAPAGQLHRAREGPHAGDRRHPGRVHRRRRRHGHRLRPALRHRRRLLRASRRSTSA